MTKIYKKKITHTQRVNRFVEKKNYRKKNTKKPAVKYFKYCYSIAKLLLMLYLLVCFSALFFKKKIFLFTFYNLRNKIKNNEMC